MLQPDEVANPVRFILQVDRCAAYRRLSGLTLAFSWAHARREFYEIAEARPTLVAERLGSLGADCDKSLDESRLKQLAAGLHHVIVANNEGKRTDFLGASWATCRCRKSIGSA